MHGLEEFEDTGNVIGTERGSDPFELGNNVVDVQPGTSESLFDEPATFGIQVPEAGCSL